MKSGPVLSQKTVKYHEPEYWKFGEEGNKYFRHATGQIYAKSSKDLATYISILLVGGAMIGVVNKFFVASICMRAAPVAILYGFNHNLLPGFSQLSPESLTLWSGILAVISVNVVIAFYIYLAMQEPSDKHEPDPKFLADAKASIKQAGPSEADSASDNSKQE